MMAMDEKSREILQRFADQFRSGAQGAHFEEAEDAQALAFAIDAALSSVQTVKPLEWEESDERWWGAMPIHGLRYEVCVTDRGSVRVRWPESGGWEDFDGDLDVAKAAAQANFEARIRSCLLPTPQPVEKPREPVTWEEQPDFTYYECPECGFDVIHRADYRCRSTACPICAGDSGHDVGMTSRPARTSDKPEGKDARPTLATPPLPAQGTVERPARVQAAFEVFKDKPGTGPNAAALFEYIEQLESALANALKALREVRGHFKVEYPDSREGKPSVGYDSEALPKVIAILDAALSSQGIR